MARIVLSKDAPEGMKLAGSFSGVVFDAGDEGYYETNDPALIDDLQRHPFYDVEFDAAPKGVASEERKLAKAQWTAEKHRAEKDPLEDAKPYPRTVEELHDLDKAEDNAAKETEEASGEASTAHAPRGQKANAKATSGGSN